MTGRCINLFLLIGQRKGEILKLRTTGMCKDILSDKDKMLLEHNIYPAMRSCVNNRYRIVLGIFIYYGAIISSKTFAEPIMGSAVNLVASIIFSLFVVHNGVNYYLNTRAEEKTLETAHRFPWIELAFQLITWALIWGAYLHFTAMYNLPAHTC